jgi:hypothetical protein
MAHEIIPAAAYHFVTRKKHCKIAHPASSDNTAMSTVAQLPLPTCGEGRYFHERG